LREVVLHHVGQGDLDSASARWDELLSSAAGGPALRRSLAHEAAYLIAYERGDLEAAARFLELEQRDLVEMNDERELVLWVNNMADLELQMGRRDAAIERMKLAVEEFIALGDVEVLLVGLETLAELLAGHQPEVCRRAFAAAAALRDEIGLPRAPAFQEEIEQLVGSAAETTDGVWSSEADPTQRVIDAWRELVACPSGVRP
jgi:tetratricopeptide (TPR) repeat protein